ncbi:PREDICTED: B-cell differentiation antigen CD72-like, partial [Phaethon lepturus]|uniref:B-cell differentiation antigen CD72-like n=1 Tax=Phaethon lepturus TaxID=97097 RepID=UPI00053090FA
VTRSLWDASQKHMAKWGCLLQEVNIQEQNLEQMQVEVAWARAELQKVWRGGNRQHLAVLEKEMQEVQGKLNNSESTVSSLCACVNTNCRPSGWMLYRGKCLFILVEKTTWWESQKYCKVKSAQLLWEEVSM